MALVISGVLNKQIAADLSIREITGEGPPRPGEAQYTRGSLADLVRVATALDSRSSPTPDTKISTDTIV
jgi:FixJ family two-component response regulator